MVGDRKETAILREGSIMARLNEEEKRVPVYFIDNYHYFDRDNIYGYYDEAERYAFFSKAVLAMLRFLNWRPEIIHCNDWQTGPSLLSCGNGNRQTLSTAISPLSIPSTTCAIRGIFTPAPSTF